MSGRDTPPQSGATTPRSTSTKVDEDDDYLEGSALWLVFTGFILSIFLIALDQTIVANALPVIASKFNALNDLSWVPTAFLLTQAPFLLVYGQVATLFPVKWVYIFTVALFEIGSLLSGVATSIGFLIFARAFQGIGAAGIFVCAISVLAEVIPLQKRPKFFGLFGGVFAISSIIGPVLGGAFTSHVSWRWCFYINLPLSVPTFWFSLQFLTAKPPRLDRNKKRKPREKGESKFLRTVKIFFVRLSMLDWLGVILVLGATTCLVLAVQWGGNSKPWSDKDVIATFVTSGVLAILFVLWEYRRGATALMPLSLLHNRTQVGCCLAALFTRMAMFEIIYYLPLYFQAVKGHSPVKSGLDLIPITLSVVLTAGIGGFIVSKTGRYWYFMVFGPIFGAVGFGLFFTIDEHTSWARLIGYQILVGISIGTTLQNSILAVQVDVVKELVPQASGLVSFSQFLGGIIGIAVAGSIFQNKLATGLQEFAPNAPYQLLRQSVTAIASLPPDEKPGAIHAYVIALNWSIMLIGVIASVLTGLFATVVRNLDMRTHKPGSKHGDPADKEMAVDAVFAKEVAAEEQAEEEAEERAVRQRSRTGNEVVSEKPQGEPTST